jgi:hypothetical protein
MRVKDSIILAAPGFCWRLYVWELWTMYTLSSRSLIKLTEHWKEFGYEVVTQLSLEGHLPWSQEVERTSWVQMEELWSCRLTLIY